MYGWKLILESSLAEASFDPQQLSCIAEFSQTLKTIVCTDWWFLIIIEWLQKFIVFNCTKTATSGCFSDRHERSVVQLVARKGNQVQRIRVKGLTVATEVCGAGTGRLVLWPHQGGRMGYHQAWLIISYAELSAMCEQLLPGGLDVQYFSLTVLRQQEPKHLVEIVWILIFPKAGIRRLPSPFMILGIGS